MVNDMIRAYTKEILENQFTLIIEENQESLLRSIPLLQVLGIESFTYPYSWRKIGKYHQFSPIEHNYKFLKTIKKEIIEPMNKKPYCMITTYFHDSNLPDHSVSSLMNVKTSSPLTFILSMEDSTKKHLSGYVRPFSHYPIIQQNFRIKYVYLFREIIKYLEETYSFESSLRDSLNLYLHLMNNIYAEIYKLEFDSTFSLIKGMIDHSLNPLIYQIIQVLETMPDRMRNQALTDIVSNFKYFFELNKSESNEILKLLLDKFERNLLEIRLWDEDNKKNKSLLKQVEQYIENLNKPIRGILCPWKKLINHFY